jgi:molybdopterin-guanine dinucleotide biosynthesis protein A
MGQPKALLLFDGEPLLVHLVRMLQHLVTDIVVVAAPGQEIPSLPVTLIRDDVPHQGPAAGLYYGLHVAQHEACFVSACDTPFLHLPLIRYLVALSPHYDVVMPRWQAQLQPLHAVYRRRVLPTLAAQLTQGDLRLLSLSQKVHTYQVTEEELRQFDDSGLSFKNLNHPADYDHALALWKKRKPSPS